MMVTSETARHQHMILLKPWTSVRPGTPSMTSRFRFLDCDRDDTLRSGQRHFLALNWREHSSILQRSCPGKWIARTVIGLCIATWQYSSFGGCPLGLMLGVLDIVGVEVRNREQVEVRENVEARETEEEDKTRKQQTFRHAMTCG